MGDLNDKTNNNVVRGAKIAHISGSALLMVCGVLAMCGLLKITLVNLFVGILCLIIGCVGIFGYFSNDVYRLAFQSDFAFGVFDIVLGIVIISGSDKLVNIVPFLVAVFAIMDGGIKAQAGFEGYLFGMHHWYWVIVCAVIMIAAGIVAIFASFMDPILWMGICMSVVGAANIFTTIYLVRIREKNEKER